VRAQDLDRTSDLLKVLGDATRVRLLSLLSEEELTVAEITRVTHLTQSRASSHLARLKEAGLVRDRREGASSFYSLNAAGMPDTARAVFEHLQESVSDPVLDDDRQRLVGVLAARNPRGESGGDRSTWADSVAGKMDRHYAPGRTWEATAWALLGLARLGDVLDVASGDGVIAELLSPRSRSVTCLDSSSKVVRAGEHRLRHCANVKFEQGDMHDLPFEAERFDQVVMMHALTFAERPEQVLGQIGRVLRPGGSLVAATLRRHRYRTEVQPYDHVWLGFEPDKLDSMLRDASFEVELCAVTSQERRRPHFEVITIHATRGDRAGRKPADNGTRQ